MRLALRRRLRRRLAAASAASVALVALAGLAGGSAAFAASAPPAPTRPELAAQASGINYTLSYRWSLVGYQGANGVDIATALANNTSADGNLTSKVLAIFSWDSTNQRWRAFFPSAANIPGANDFTTLTSGTAYWIAIAVPAGLTWTT